MADISNLEGIDEFKKYFLEVMKKQLLDTFVDKTSREGNVNKTQAIRNIKSAFSNDKLVLVLGAGISMQFGIPDWETLLQKLMVKTIDEKLSHPDIIANLFNYTFSPSPLIAARYLQKHFESERLSFEKEVKNVLYSKYKQDTSSELVNEIVNLCVAPGKSPNLNSIITYNYDDIIEQKISELNLPIPYKSIYGTGMLPENDELPIFHVHGFLPRKGGVGRNNMITLGESMYHEQYN
ncbi:MAG: SIR2 family protein, partial [bacterium]